MGLILSIIVPVYNVRPYLEKCVQSLLDQDLDAGDYEVILVDDGSTDGGGDICNRIQKENANIRVIHQVNQGLSVARNTGLSAATGKYIQFVDSDDWIESRVLRGLVRKMEDDSLDVLRFGCRRVSESGEIHETGHSVRLPEGSDRVQTGSSYLLHHLWFTCYACQFLLRRVFLVENQLFFKPGILFEDTQWTPRMLETAKRVCGVDTMVYNYFERNGSITRGKVRNRVAAQFNLIEDLKGQMSEAYDKRWYEGMISHLVVSIISVLALDLYHERKPFIRRMREIGVLPLSRYQATRKAGFKICLINFSPTLACALIHCLNR